MSVQGLKENLHKQIEALENEMALQLLLDAAVDYNNFTQKDIVDVLSEEQRNRLSQSILQAKEGNTIPHEEAKKQISKWRGK